MSGGGVSPSTAASTVSSSALVPRSRSSAAPARTGVGPTEQRAIEASVTASPSSCRLTAAPAIAKSPWRRANSTKAWVAPGAATGKLTSLTISPGSSTVSKGPRKKSAAGTVREPEALTMVTVAPSATATVGSSAAGSAWAMLPTTVPDRLVGDRAQRLVQQWHLLAHLRRPLHRRLPGRRADGDRAVVAAHVGQLLERVDVDQVLRLGEPEVHQRHQALAAGEDPP